MRNPTCVLSFILLFMLGSAEAQDKHFTLFHLAPLSLNPALTGAMKGEFRAAALYRNQWRAVGKPFSTITAYADKKFVFKQFDLGIGLSFLNDRTGPGHLNTINIAPSFSFQKSFGKHSLILGVQASFVHKQINEGTYPSQYDHSTGSYNTAFDNGEIDNSFSKIYLDLNAGLNYIYRSKNNELQIGQAFHHLNMPNESLISDDKNKLPMRLTTHLSYLHWLSEKIYIKPSVLYMSHNKASEFVLNAYLGYRLAYKAEMQLTMRLGAAFRNNTKSVSGNSFFANSDATSLLLGATWNKIDLDFAYDINISKLSEVGKNAGAFEIALTYNNLFERKPERITIPCRRY